MAGLNRLFGALSSIISTTRECPIARKSLLVRHSQSPSCSSSSSSFIRANSTLVIRPTLRAGLKQAKRGTRNLPEIPSSKALGMLKSEENHYLVTFLVGKKYRLMVDDQVTVPHIKDLKVGDLIKLTRITEVGSRNFTLRAVGNGTVGHAKRETHAPAASKTLERKAKKLGVDPSELVREARTVCLKPEIPHYLDEELVHASAIVVEHTRGKMITVIKKKRRKGYRKTIKNKPYYTKIRLCEIKIPSIQTEAIHSQTPNIPVDASTSQQPTMIA
ncbi:hypothetical protein MJO28_002702 [Puccinia striiformis f. sp. tritici]|uniref:Large ribosomal subunit protein bL21m n=4 Tax=Puccinia striiformis TaxID=27350 RepID=A0A0L0UUV8_9BASI|nr:hypothetical protein Pst134EA_005327 [Puccinia striiformis f. sp. tritici]KAI9619175.1 hypothetical protein H4Q26_011855 [Puccinia striiformis f. sp. tritici PST-130]KNE90524.1 hypothetical protein PSTG_16041 [Puccinia striiformis f. sp. tritici PST-78]POV96768.1 hypothetical protein PSTT_15464 [Puccinia striiformis]KAH9462523.1 hypothetical protein Pst134EB_006415 [Puccinia striiformis f. sp. tritici]KAH9471427.1 hypothetical protein Pst134EA_005327 [Puccinia striiformis f. sp. tritici]